MEAAEVERLFAELKFKCDIRRPPDERRCGQFQAGWQDATRRTKAYAPKTLARLTWRNLGYRFGEREGPRPLDEIEAVYRILEQRYSSLWVPRSSEDHLLQAYWQRVRGRVYVEVPIGGTGGAGNWPAGGSRRRLDGVRFPAATDAALVRFTLSAFQARVSSGAVELIEVKRSLNRPVIGQIIAGRDMFRRQYGASVCRLVVVCGQTDTALEWVCQQNEVTVETVSPG